MRNAAELQIKGRESLKPTFFSQIHVQKFEMQQIKYQCDEEPLDFVVHQMAMCSASVTDEVAKLFV